MQVRSYILRRNMFCANPFNPISQNLLLGRINTGGYSNILSMFAATKVPKKMIQGL
jgi:hypothetical protein